MAPIEQKDWAEEDRASILGQNHPLDSTKRQSCFAAINPLAILRIGSGVIAGMMPLRPSE
jgi:hypothetical protein